MRTSAVLAFCSAMILGISSVAPAQTFTLLHVFHGPDGGAPEAPLLLDSSGTIYSTTAFGGASGLGTVFTIDKKNREKVLHSFTGGADGQNPNGGVVFGSDGNLYGDASAGSTGQGLLFKVDPGDGITVLYNFKGSPDANNPGQLLPGARKLYGIAGGGPFFAGTVFQWDRASGEQVLHSFVGGADGSGLGPLAKDPSGNLFGAAGGGNLTCNAPYGCGLIFKLDPKGNYSILHVFIGLDGKYPQGPLLLDAAGNLYGTTSGGGAHDEGIVFKLTPAGQLSTLYSFTGGADGGQPHAGLVRDGAGNFFGTTFAGGTVNDKCFGFGCGVVFQLSPSGATWTETVLHSFNGDDGDNPLAPVTLDTQGRTLYGTAYRGGDYNCHTINAGTSCGVVFKIVR